MALDIIPMGSVKAKCPCCGKTILVDWQVATYSDGGDSFQFVGLRPDENDMAEALREKTFKGSGGKG